MASPSLTRPLRQQLWAEVAARLQRGEALLTNRDFVGALESAYEGLTGQEAGEVERLELRRMVEAVNRAHPETYLAQGLQNGINRAFEDGVRRLNWDVGAVQSKGARALRRFRRSDAVRDFLEEASLRPEQIDVLDCLQGAIGGVGGHHRPESPPPAPRPLRPAPEPGQPIAASPAEPAGEAVTLDRETQALVESGEVDGKEARRRLERAERRHSELESQEMEKVPRRLASFVEQGVVTEEEARQLKELREVDARVKRGEITEDVAADIRNSILKADIRDRLERRVRDAVSDTVKYLQVYEAMQKINPDYHDALAFLIEHKTAVTSTAGSGSDMSGAIHGLMGDVEILDRVIDIMERKDQEVRMLSVRLHPYTAIMKRGLERIDNMVIEPTFVDELENISIDEMSERLHSDDKLVRVRPAADMRCLISIVDHVTKKTPFRKELRLLRISKQLEEYYKSTADVHEARHQAESFLNRRLRRLFPDMDTDEAAELKQRSSEMMDQIEQRILEERRAAVEEKRQKSERAPAAKGQEGEGGDEEIELTEEEINKGVQIGRVEMRVAGSTRRIPQKIMPDPDEPERFVLVVRDPETRELVPAMRRGNRRYVERSREGFWQEER
ncbi:MAG: hypothetical protein ABIL09_28620 [Gemmatimonadota bacterium]